MAVYEVPRAHSLKNICNAVIAQRKLNHGLNKERYDSVAGVRSYGL